MREKEFIDFAGELSLGSYIFGAFLSLISAAFFPQSLLALVLIAGVQGILIAQWIGRHEARKRINRYR